VAALYIFGNYFMNIHKYLIGLSILLFGSGVAIAAPIGLSWLEQQQATATSSNVTVATPQTPLKETPTLVKGIPRHISVSSLGIDVSIADGVYDERTGEWTLSDTSAFYATPTNPVNSDSGNTLIYGHNSDEIFGKLLKIQQGAEVTVTTDNGYVFTYVYTSTEAVRPTDTRPLVYEGKPRLTLQTCSGIWNQTRQMFYFDLKEYHKA